MHRILPFLLACLLLILFRIAGSWFPEALPNFQPLAALFFCGVWMAPGARGFLLPLALWALTFPLGAGHPPGAGLFLTTLLAFAASFGLGWSMRSARAGAWLAGSVVAALMFHGITSLAAWWADPMYVKSPIGLWQSLWSGPPGGVLPSWVFLRNLVAAHVIFTGLFLLARYGFPRMFAPRRAGHAAAC